MRRAEHAFVAEGAKLLEAALDARAPIEGVYRAPEALESRATQALLAAAGAAGIRVFGLGRGVMERVADATTPQPVCAVVGMLDVPLEEVLAASSLLVCVDVRDPGNLGAIVRSADAAGVGGVVCCGTSVDLYNPKTVRASAGSCFHVPLVVVEDPRALLARLREAGFRLLGTVARGGTDYADARASGKVALVLGNEAQGLDPALSAELDELVTIPMAGRAESLNVAMAATVLSFDLARRRRAAGA